MFDPIKFSPIPKERIWGGHDLKKQFGVKSKAPIGEYWVLSSHPNGESIVSTGPLAGTTLNDLTSKYPQYFLGNSHQKRFPLLIKFLEVTENLSVQVHPDDNYAKINEDDFGKTECWYFLETKKDTSIIYGHHFKNREEFLQAAGSNQIRDYLINIPIKSEQAIYVPSQTLHALLANTKLIEIQQTSDVTYRIYDWDRVNKDGNRRELHFEKAADVLIYGTNPSRENGSNPLQINTTDEIIHEQLTHCPYFTVEKIYLKKHNYLLPLGNEGNPDILVVANGNGSLQICEKKEYLPLYTGDTVLIPSHIRSYQIFTKVGLKLLRIFY